MAKFAELSQLTQVLIFFIRLKAMQPKSSVQNYPTISPLLQRHKLSTAVYKKE
jgi:hypothetical protein